MSDSRTAWAHGLATVASDGSTIDAWYPSPRLGLRPAGLDPLIAPAELERQAGADSVRAVELIHVSVEIDLDAPPASVPDAYLRLHVLSHCLAKPNTINLDGLFGLLPTVCWTNAGPMLPA